MFSYIPLASVAVCSGDKIGRYLCPHWNVIGQNHENPLCFHTFCGHASADDFDANHEILSKRARAGAKTAPSRPRKSPRWLQDAFRLPKIACKMLTDSLKCFQQGQAWPQELPNCPQMALHCHERAGSISAGQPKPPSLPWLLLAPLMTTITLV